jgi:hypothetical protein
MGERRQSIFRASAWERYVRAHEERVLPRFVRPRSLVLLWLLVATLLLACALAWSVRIGSAPPVSSLLPALGDLIAPGP